MDWESSQRFLSHPLLRLNAPFEFNPLARGGCDPSEIRRRAKRTIIRRKDSSTISIGLDDRANWTFRRSSRKKSNRHFPSLRSERNQSAFKATESLPPTVSLGHQIPTVSRLVAQARTRSCPSNGLACVARERERERERERSR